MTDIREALTRAADYLTRHPAEARYTDSPATAVLEHGLLVRTSGPSGEELTTDMPASVGGGASSPSPGWLLRAAEASCVATLLAMRAAQLDIHLQRVEVRVDSESDDRGILGLDDGVVAGPLRTRIVVRITADEQRAVLEALADWAVDHCPVVDAVRRAVPLRLEVDLLAE